MSPATLDDDVIVATTSAPETDVLIARWRGLARLCLEVGMIDRARFCERQASNLEWEPVPCSA